MLLGKIWWMSQKQGRSDQLILKFGKRHQWWASDLWAQTMEQGMTPMTYSIGSSGLEMSYPCNQWTLPKQWLLEEETLSKLIRFFSLNHLLFTYCHRNFNDLAFSIHRYIIIFLIPSLLFLDCLSCYLQRDTIWHGLDWNILNPYEMTPFIL